MVGPVSKVDQVMIPPVPLAFNSTVSPAQMSSCMGFKTFTLGLSSSVMVMLSESVPHALVTLTVYVPAADTVILGAVTLVDQVKNPEPIALKVRDSPEQMAVKP